MKDAFADYARDCFAPARPILTAAEALMVKLHREFAYSPGETTIAHHFSTFSRDAAASARTLPT